MAGAKQVHQTFLSDSIGADSGGFFECLNLRILDAGNYFVGLLEV